MYYLKYIITVLLLTSLLLCAQDFPKIEGWQIRNDVLKYNPENLWEYINGGADQFIDYGFESLLAGELSNNSILITADIYDMGLPLNAFGIYMTQRPEESGIFNIGTEASISLPAQCLLLKDRYYVKIQALNGELSESTSKYLLDAIAKALPGNTDFPNEFSLLPDNGQIKGSFRHVRRNFLGLVELSNCVYANYLDDRNEEFSYFIVISEAENTTKTIWDTIRNKWKSLEQDEKQIYYRKIPYKGFVGVIQKDLYLLGVANVTDENVLKDRIKILYNR